MTATEPLDDLGRWARHRDPPPYECGRVDSGEDRVSTSLAITAEVRKHDLDGGVAVVVGVSCDVEDRSEADESVLLDEVERDGVEWWVAIEGDPSDS